MNQCTNNGTNQFNPHSFDIYGFECRGNTYYCTDKKGTDFMQWQMYFQIWV